jgi:hypothetical protein
MRKKLELYEEKFTSLESEISRLKQLLHARDSELQSAKDEARAFRESAAAANGKESDVVSSKDLKSLSDELAEARSTAAKAVCERDDAFKREADLLQQFEELKQAFHAATEQATAAPAVAPEFLEKLKKDAEAARTSEMSTRGELCLMKEQLEAHEHKLQHMQTQLQAEKQRCERLRREKDDLELANSCMKGEMNTMKRVTVNQDRCVPLPRLFLWNFRRAGVTGLRSATRLFLPMNFVACARLTKQNSKRGLNDNCCSLFSISHPLHHQIINCQAQSHSYAPCSRAHLDREVHANAIAM